MLVFCVAVSLVSCKDDKPTEENTTATQATKETTAVPVEIADIPSGKDERVEMLNSALDYIDVYCLKYTKKVKCTVSDVSVGSLSKASNAVAAFKSIFGEKETSTDYDYDSAPESFNANAVSARFSADDISSIDAKQDGSYIVVKAVLPNEMNPDEKSGQLFDISTDCLSVENIKKNLSDFSSSAGSVNINASDITVTAYINEHDSSLGKLVVSYTERFSLGSVKLVKLEGSSVTGTSKTVVTYDSIG